MGTALTVFSAGVVSSFAGTVTGSGTLTNGGTGSLALFGSRPSFTGTLKAAGGRGPAAGPRPW